MFMFKTLENTKSHIAGGTDKDAHFAVVHYAGTVNYNLTGYWLEKILSIDN